MHTVPVAVFGIFALLSFTARAQAQTPVVGDWSGAYLGASVGAAHARAKTQLATADGFPGSYFTPPDPQQITAAADADLSQSTLSGGLFAGFGTQHGNLYLGAETSVHSLRFDESRTAGATYLSNPAGAFTHALSVKADWQATLRARVGFAHERWLAYVTGGAAVTQIRLAASFADDFLGTGASGRSSSTETKLGWVAGLGGEYALSEHWTVKGEYLYADYGKVDTATTVNNPAFPTLANRLESSADLKTQTLSIGMAYRF